MKKEAILAAVMAFALAATMALAGCQSGSTADQDAIKKDLTTKLDAVKAGDIDGLDELLGENALLKDLNLDTTKFIEAYTNGFTYEIGDIKVNESAGTATVEVKINAKSVDSIVSEWASNFANNAKSMSAADLGSSSELTRELGDSLLEAIETAAPVDFQTVTFSYTKASDGTWQMDDFVKQLYQALGLDSVGDYANLLCKQLGLSDVTDLGAEILGALR